MIKKRRGELSIEIVLTLPKRSPNTIENMNQKIDDFEVERLLYSYDEEEEPGRGWDRREPRVNLQTNESLVVLGVECLLCTCTKLEKYEFSRPCYWKSWCTYNNNSCDSLFRETPVPRYIRPTRYLPKPHPPESTNFTTEHCKYRATGCILYPSTKHNRPCNCAK